MAIEIQPRVRIQPVRSQTGGADGRVTPMRDATGRQLQQLGEGAQDVGRALTAMADKKQDHIDIGMSLDTSSLYTEEDEKAYDAPGGFLTTVGKEANDERRKQAEQRMRERRSKLEATLQNEAQKLNFRQHADHVDARSRSRANAHQVHQARVFEAGERKAAADAGIREAIKFAGTEEGEVTRQLAMQHFDAWGELVGMPPSMLKNEKQKATDQYHEGVVGRIVNDANNAPLARMYFEKHKGEMSPDTEQKIGAFVKQATVRDESTRFSMQAIQVASEQGGTLAEQMGYALQVADFTYKGKKISAEVRDEAQQRIEKHFRQQKFIEDSADNELVQQATTALLRDPMASPTDLPVEMRTRLEERGLMGDVNAFQNSGKRFATDPDAFAEVANIPAASLRHVTAAALVRAYRGRLDDSDLKWLLAKQASATGKASKEQRRILTDNERVVEGFYRATGRDRSKELNDEGKTELYRWQKRVQDVLDAEPEPASDERLQEIIDAVANDRVIARRRGIFGADFLQPDQERNAAVLSEEQRRDAYLKPSGVGRVFVSDEPVELGDIPKEVREQIEIGLQRKRVYASDAEVMRQWIREGRPMTAQ